MQTREKAFLLGQLLVKIGFHDVYEWDRSLPTSRDELAEVLRSQADGCASFLGVSVDTKQVQTQRSPLPWLTKIRWLLAGGHDELVASSFDLGFYLVYYVAVTGGYPVNQETGATAAQVEEFHQRLFRPAAAIGIDVALLAPIVDEARKAGTLAFDMARLKSTAEAAAARISELLLQQPESDQGATVTRVVKILFLAANPSTTTRLRLDEEIRSIDEALRLSDLRDSFEISQHWAVRVGDLQGYLMRHKPDIVHFCGHGAPAGEIYLENDTGQSAPVPPQALAATFAVLNDTTSCVVLNACFSYAQAEAIAKHIDFVVGMSETIDDQAAIRFARSFYQAFGFGRTIADAFELGCAQIELENLNDEHVPRLLARERDPKTTSFF